jgi:hypothetical protein
LLFIKKILSIFIVSEDLEFCEQYDAFLRRWAYSSQMKETVSREKKHNANERTGSP